jgi:SulP family sulfate permease
VRDFSKLKKSLNNNSNIKINELSRFHSIKTLGSSGNIKQIKPINVFTDSLQFLKSEWGQLFIMPYWLANISSGITVAAVALPLNIALAIASGLPASAGLISGAIGGAIAALVGGSKFQATGPAAALSAMVGFIVQQHGVAGAAAAAILVGAIQLILFLFKAGNLMKFVPEVVLLGFTSGVGLKLLDSQIPKLFGIEWSLYEMLNEIANPIWLHEVTWPAVVCGLFVILFILSCKSLPRFPAALFGIAITTQLAIFLNWPIHRVGEIPPLQLSLEWPQFALKDWLSLLQLSLPLGLLAAAESVLSAQAIDRMSGDKHHSNLEIFGQGLANFATGLTGGLPVSGVIVRSSVNVQSGAKNRLGSFFHASILLGSALFMGGILAQIPIAALAGLLCIIGFRLIEFGELTHLLKQNKWKALGFLAAAIGTLTNHIVIGLVLGLAIVWLNERPSNKKKDESTPLKVSEDNPSSESLETEILDKSVVYKVLDRGERWLHHLKEQATIPNTAYVHPNASVIGRVVLGRNVHVAAEASIRADEGTPFYIGDDTNVQDGVVIHALKKKWITIHNEKWAVYVGKGVSMAHQALVHGPCFIGDKSFIGFKAVVHDSIVGAGCYIGIGATVVGVEIPEGRYVPHGAVIDTKDKALNLTKVSPQHQHFNEDVVEVNRGLAEAYRELDQTENKKFI